MWYLDKATSIPVSQTSAVMLLEPDTLEAQVKRLTALRTLMHADASDRWHRGLLPRSQSMAQDFHFGQ